MSALHAAAVELLADAPPMTVRAVLKLLLKTPAAPGGTGAAVAGLSERWHYSGDATPSLIDDRRTPATAADNVTRSASPSVSCPPENASSSVSWLALKAEIRVAMKSRGIDFETLASMLGYTPGTMRNSVLRTTPPKQAQLVKLRAWLADTAPAAAVTTFPRTGHNGASATP